MVPLFSPEAVHAGLALDAALARVLASQRFILGAEVRAFEEEFAAWHGVPHCVGVANGTDALELALRAVGVGAGGDVLCTANAGFYAAAAAGALTARVRPVEIDPRTLTMSPDALAAALAQGARPAAVVVTHLYGQLADVAALGALCRDAGVPWIEDVAQAHGARRAGQCAGTFADAGCFSFYPTKNLGALGDGGAVVTRDAEVADRIRALRQYGWAGKYEVRVAGGRNSRLDELQAAVLRGKLPQLDAHNRARRAIAARYNAAFAGLPLQLPASTGEDHVAHLYVVRTDQRDALRAHLQEQGVASDVHYPIPDHRQPVWQGDAAMAALRLPHTEAACASVLSLPCFPGLAPEQVDRVIAAVLSFFAPERRP